MSWKEDTEADIVLNNMDSQDDTVDLERESATEERSLNSIGPEDTRVNLEGTETSEYASLGDAGPNVYRTAQKVLKQFTITRNRKKWKKIRPSKGSTKLRPL